ncbi:hypothetical protein [Streptomyces sp. NPDC021356]|uniref:hypothetical protein n=1 Tax=Streptomyces sp. NPDC021356 TaxID=3154900 RepID=UPI0033E9F172
MIASTPVARWIWGRDDETADPLVCCLHDLLKTYGILVAQSFATGMPMVRVVVSEAGKSNSYLLQSDLAVDFSAPDAVKLLTDQVRAALRPGEIGSVDGSIECSGSVVTSADGAVVRQEKLFRLSASSFADFVSVDLVTHSDVWLPYDLKGRSQSEIYELNGHRLSTLLRTISEVLDTETDPDDPTYFAKPTETGAENYFDPDGKASDVWRSFEVPTRYDVFTHAPGFGRIGYRRTAEGEVQCVPVHGGQGELFGHLWVSVSEKAASFEPCDVGDDATYRAGLVWLERLRSAHDRGLSPSEALVELTSLPDENGSGRASDSEPRTMSLAALREGLAGR